MLQYCEFNFHQLNNVVWPFLLSHTQNLWLLMIWNKIYLILGSRIWRFIVWNSATSSTLSQTQTQTHNVYAPPTGSFSSTTIMALSGRFTDFLLFCLRFAVSILIQIQFNWMIFRSFMDCLRFVQQMWLKNSNRLENTSIARSKKLLDFQDAIEKENHSI